MNAAPSAGSPKILVGLRALSGRGLVPLRETVSQLTKQYQLLAISSLYLCTQHRGARSPRDERARSQRGGGARSLREGAALAAAPLAEANLSRGGELAALAAVIMLETELSPLECSSHLLELRTHRRSDSNLGSALDLELLVYNQLAQMSPALTLPHPDLHTNPSLLVPAAEVWGDYLHPILEKSLSEIAAQLGQLDWGEFYAQGKSLLDL